MIPNIKKIENNLCYNKYIMDVSGCLKESILVFNI